MSATPLPPAAPTPAPSSALISVDLATTAQAAKALHVCQKTILNEIYRGKIRAIRVGGTWKIPVAVINAILGGESQPASASA